MKRINDGIIFNGGTYSFPSNSGTVGQVLSSDGVGGISWATASGGGSQTLAQTLTEGNETGVQDIIMNEGARITSENEDAVFSLSESGQSSFSTLESIGISTGTFIDIDASSQYVSVNDLRHESSTVTTTDATVTTIASVSLGGFGASASNMVEAYVTGIGDGKGYGAKLFAIVKSDFPLSTSTLVKNMNLTQKSEFSTTTSTINISGSNIMVRVTGEAATNITWYCKLIYTND